MFEAGMNRKSSLNLKRIFFESSENTSIPAKYFPGPRFHQVVEAVFQGFGLGEGGENEEERAAHD